MAYPYYGQQGYGRGYSPAANHRYEPYSPYRGTRGRGRGVARAWQAPVSHHRQPNQSTDPANTKSQEARTLKIEDIDFSISSDGRTLTRITPLDQGPPTPRKTQIAGVDFFSTTKGNHLYRFDKIAELQEKKARRPPTPPPAPPKLEQLCLHFNTTGECRNARDCRYTHDFSKVAICKDFLMTGNCSRHDCQLSHDPTPNRSPACIHFSRGNCTNPTCRYAHVKIDPAANVCRDFAILGFCEKGADCTDRHVTECPDYANTGICSNKKCRLPHVDRAGQLRKIAGVPNTPTQHINGSPKSTSEEAENDGADVDDSIESDDIESPTFAIRSLTEQSNDAKSSFSQQEDYIRL